MKYLFENFLHDKKVYNLNEAFYKKLLESITHQIVEPFFKKSFANGQKIYDEHIFSAKINDRLVQIIQKEPSHDKPFLKIMTKKWEDKTDMLIVTLELSNLIKGELKRLLHSWFVEKASEDVVKNYFAKPLSAKNYTNFSPSSAIHQVAEPTTDYETGKKEQD